MPIEFLTQEQRSQYGQFSGESNENQLARYFHFDDTDLFIINSRRRDHNRFGFALQLATVRFLGTFLADPSNVPESALTFIANQIGIEDISCLKKYIKRKSVRYEHTAEIQHKYGYHEFNAGLWRFKLSRLLYTRSWVSNERPSVMFDFSTAWLIQHKVLLPGVTTLSRLISEIRERTNNRLSLRLSSLPDMDQKEKLNALLRVPEGSNYSPFDTLRHGPTTISGPSFNAAIDRYVEFKSMGIQSLNFKHIPLIRLKSLARYAGITSMHKILRMQEDRRIATLMAFVYVFERTALDDALDVFDLLFTQIIMEAKKIHRQKRLRSLKDLDKSALLLADACAIILKGNI